MTAVGTNESEWGLFGPSLGALAPTAVQGQTTSVVSSDGLEDQGEGLSFHETPVAIVEPTSLSAMGELAASRGFLWVKIDPPGPQYRGRLGLYLEEAVEAELEERGALAPGIHSSTGLDASLSDQLYRARLVEMRGIAIGIPSLEGIVNLARALDADDSAVLRWWMAATADRPVRLVISNRNMNLRVYPSPILFESLFEVAPGPVTPIPPSPQMASSAEAMELSDLPPEIEAFTNVHGTTISDPEEETHLPTPEESKLPKPATSWKLNPQKVADSPAGLPVQLPELDEALGLLEPMQSDASDFVDTEPCNTSEEFSPIPDLQEVSVRNSASETGFAGIERDATNRGDFEGFIADNFEDSSAESSAEDSRISREARGGKGKNLVRSAENSSTAVEDDSIDAEDFLRTLEEDSARAPSVEDAGEGVGDQIGQSLATPQLPTKKILRNPFIRMAETETSKTSSDEDLEGPVLDPKALSEGQVVQAPTVAAARGQSGDTRPSEAGARSDLDPQDRFNQLAEREWKNWVKNLEAARGPKPLSVIERMFVTDYIRLREAVRRGVAATSANSILDEWQSSFEQSYSAAFDALRVRGKRPTMVLDLPELANRLGRLQGAKRVQLLLVDGMRFDLGLMIQDRMRSTADAALTERLLLWSALPTETAYQLNLLAAGPDGLKDKDLLHADEPPALVARGKAARVPRRVKCGKLELLKLDVVEDSLRPTDRPVSERLSDIATETAAAIVEHLSKQPPRTMVVVFGDHGFSLNPAKAGTAEEVTTGGASPEEVLVPAFAWLTGAVH